MSLATPPRRGESSPQADRINPSHAHSSKFATPPRRGEISPKAVRINPSFSIIRKIIKLPPSRIKLTQNVSLLYFRAVTNYPGKELAG